MTGANPRLPDLPSMRMLLEGVPSGNYDERFSVD